MVSDTTSSDSLSSVENEYAFLLRPSDSTLPQPTDVLISPIDSLFLSYAAAPDSNNGIVLPFSAADTVAYRKSLFTGHYLQPSHADYQHRTPPQQDGWIGFCVVVIAFILCIYYRFHRLSLQEIFVAVFSNHVFNIVQRENNLLRSMSLMPSLLVYAATMAVFALSLQHPVHPAPIVIVLQLFLIMAALLILRNGGISYFGSVFANSEATQRYIHQGYLQQLIVATIMLPIMLAGIYLPISSTVYTIVAFIPLTFFFFTNLLRCVQIIFSYPKDTNLFLIYYLCILEIAPILIAIKIGISL